MNIIKGAGARFHYVMVAGVITTDLVPHIMKGEYRETLRKGKNLAVLFFAQHLIKKVIPGTNASSQFMVGVQCYIRVCERDKNFYASSIIAIATAVLGLRSFLSRNHGLLDLVVAGVAGKVFGTFWNYALD